MEDTVLKTPDTDSRPVDDAPKPQETAAPKKPSAFRRLSAILSLLVAAIAWCIYFFDAGAAAVIAAVGVVTAILGITVGRGCLRDTAITALIASLVLLIVLATFYWGIPAAIASI